MTVICLNAAGDQASDARAAGIRVIEVGFPGLRRSALLNPVPLIRQVWGFAESYGRPRRYRPLLPVLGLPDGSTDRA